LTPRALSLLVALLEARGQLVEKDHLLASVWSDAVVEEGSLAWHISLLRKVLDGGLGGRNFIETIPRRGDRSLCPVEETDRADEQRGRTIRLAVLALTDLNREDGSAFAEGLTEEIGTEITRQFRETLVVIAHASTMRYRGTRNPVARIGNELEAEFVID